VRKAIANAFVLTLTWAGVMFTSFYGFDLRELLWLLASVSLVWVALFMAVFAFGLGLALGKEGDKGSFIVALTMLSFLCVGFVGFAMTDLVICVIPRAACNSLSAQVRLAELYLEGQSLPKDEAKALKWFRAAAKHGHPDAEFHLGVIYELGLGVPKFDEEACGWYRAAAERGHARGQAHLGIMYASGRGVAKDYAAAVRWYRTAADIGNSLAQFHLGLMYADGLGVPKDETESYKWLLRAAAQGYAEARKAIPEIEKSLTPTQRAEGQRRARELRAQGVAESGPAALDKDGDHVDSGTIPARTKASASEGVDYVYDSTTKRLLQVTDKVKSSSDVKKGF